MCEAPARFSPPQPCIPSSKPPVRLNQGRPMATRPPLMVGMKSDSSSNHLKSAS